MFCRRLCLFAACVLPLTVTTLPAQENNQPPAGFTALFNGKDLTGFYGAGTIDPRKSGTYYELAPKIAADQAQFNAHWKVENGELVNDGTGTYATTAKDYGDIELWVDFKILPKGDSGVYLRGTPQVQIWDFTEAGGNWKNGGDKGSGGLWNNRAGSPGKDPSVLADKPLGEWNRFRIQQVGDKTWVWLNGKLVVEGAALQNYFDRNGNSPIPARGPIQLQTHGSEVRWRNIFVREIPSPEAISILRGKDPEGFTSIFNGKDFTGWQGATENYEIVGGAIRCKPDKGGNLFTNDEYADFVARVEFLLPEDRNNNGLAIRYPGTGDPAYTGMCELQVVNSDSPRMGPIDARQAHGSAYGMIAAHKGYLRPANQWNYEQVTVKGSTIKVELNGTTILDGDLSKVTQFMANSPHPGKDRTTGYFGFCGHRDPVEFRNISIKKL